MKFELMISNRLKLKHYAFVMNNLRYDKYVDGSNNYVVVSLYIKPKRSTLPQKSMYDIDVYFHDKCILILNDEKYYIDEPCKIRISKDSTYQIKSIRWFGRTRVTSIHLK